MHPSEASLRAFILKAHTNTYVGGDRGREQAPSRPGATEYRYKEGNFTYQDVSFGSRTFVGGEVVYFNGFPVWAMNYHGALTLDIDKRVGFGFLGKALLAGAKKGDLFRGPEKWAEGGFEYTCRCRGDQFSDDFQSFSGWEHIYMGPRGVYACYFHGGVIQD